MVSDLRKLLGQCDWLRTLLESLVEYFVLTYPKGCGLEVIGVRMSDTVSNLAQNNQPLHTRRNGLWTIWARRWESVGRGVERDARE